MNNDFKEMLQKLGQGIHIATENDTLVNQLFIQRIEQALEVSLQEDIQYLKAEKTAFEKVNFLDTLGLNAKQNQAIDTAITALNDLGNEYGRVAYLQGFRDSLKLITELHDLL